MAIAIISDLHSNLEALTEVLKDVKSHGITDIFCLGDLVGYGPNPAEIVQKCFDFKVVLMGNHDEGVLKSSYGFNPIAKVSVDWTRDQLQPQFMTGRLKAKIWSFLLHLPIMYKLNGVTFVHASPRDPLMEYILRSDCMDIFGRPSDKLLDIFERIEWLCFIGHTHDPGVVTQDGRFLTPSSIDYHYKFEKNSKYLINVGSVGQPRDSDPRACYVIFDTDYVKFRRIEYDYHATMHKIFKIGQLDKKLGERLALGR